MAESLLEEIRDRIDSAGPLPFESFMRLALYHPRHGYYATRVPGEGGHYGTSPSVSPWFGRLVMRELQAMWRALGCPEEFTVIEVGPGRGDLAAAALGAAGPLGPALRWRFVERFASVAEIQRRRLGAAAARVEWSPHLGVPPAAAGCVIAHEVLDNFPVHLLETGAGATAVQEVYVTVAGSGLAERLGPLSDPALLDQATVPSAPGRRFEVCSDLDAFARDAAGALGRGYLLVIDYGDREEALWASNPRGTVVTYGPEGFGSDPLRDPGARDITADVNFSAVARATERAGFQPQQFVTQRDWLLGLGLADEAAALERAADAAWAEDRREAALAIEEQLGLLRTLTAHMGLGDIMVFRAAKQAPELAPGEQAR
jgi:SAM-dependent MidA family methyltransferase